MQADVSSLGEKHFLENPASVFLGFVSCAGPILFHGLHLKLAVAEIRNAIVACDKPDFVGVHLVQKTRLIAMDVAAVESGI